MNSKKYVLEFIDFMKSEIKNRPQCHHFALHLKGKFSDALIYSSGEHCITRIDGEWYDWDGIAEYTDKFLPFPESYGDQHIVNYYRATEDLFLNRNELYRRDGMNRKEAPYRDAANMPTIDDKHYIPSIDEFGMGFEYKIWNDSYFGDENGEQLAPGTTWINRTVGMGIWDLQSQVNRLLDKGHVCVKYLDREDIENLGFDHISTSGHLNQIDTYEIHSDPKYAMWRMKVVNEMVEKEAGKLVTDREVSMKVSIRFFHPDDGTGEIWFYGNIKNKSQLKQILQWTRVLKKDS